jgi:hypothetical protein
MGRRLVHMSISKISNSQPERCRALAVHVRPGVPARVHEREALHGAEPTMCRGKVHRWSGRAGRTCSASTGRKVGGQMGIP